MKQYSVAIIFSLAIATLTVDHVTLAANDEPESMGAPDTFARPLERTPPKFPKSARNRHQEGWVDVSYIVQPDGTVTDPIVDESSGIVAFEESALQAVINWKFIPATRNGLPIEQCQTKTRLIFAQNGPRGARWSFQVFIKNILKLIENGEFDTALAQIRAQREKGQWSLFEYSRLWMLEAHVAYGQGDEMAQLTALYRAGGRTGNFIEQDLFKKMLPRILYLELKLSHYSAALDTYDVMKKFPDLMKENEQLEKSVDGLIYDIQSDRTLSVPGEISMKAGRMISWDYRLLRREFAFDKVNGKLERLELRCDWKHFSDEISQDVAWMIPESWGKCQLYVYGNIGTTFTFLEYPEETESQSNTFPLSNETYTFNQSAKR